MAFETTSIVTDFDVPAPENPFSDSGAWSGGFWTRPPLQGGAPGGGGVYGTVEFAVNGMYYRREAFGGPIVEAFGCISDPGIGAALSSHRVALYLDPQNLGPGYSSGYGGGISKVFFLRKYDGGGNFIGIGDVPNTTNDIPERLGLRITPERVEQWGYYAGTWVLITYAEDDDYRGTFYAALETEEQGGVEEVAFGCFGASTVNRTHIYRLLKGVTSGA